MRVAPAGQAGLAQFFYRLLLGTPCVRHWSSPARYAHTGYPAPAIVCVGQRTVVRQSLRELRTQGAPAGLTSGGQVPHSPTFFPNKLDS